MDTNVFALERGRPSLSIRQVSRFSVGAPTNRLGMPPYGEVELATGTVGGRRREGDGGYVNVREHVLVVMMMVMMMIIVIVLLLLLLRHVKTKKRQLQSASRFADADVVARGGRQVRQGGAPAQVVVLAVVEGVRQECARYAGHGAEQTRRQARADRRVRDAELPDGIHARAGDDVLEGRRPRAATLAKRGPAQTDARHRQRRSATAALAGPLLRIILSRRDHRSLRLYLVDPFGSRATEFSRVADVPRRRRREGPVAEGRSVPGHLQQAGRYRSRIAICHDRGSASAILVGRRRSFEPRGLLPRQTFALELGKDPARLRQRRCWLSRLAVRCRGHFIVPGALFFSRITSVARRRDSR